MIKKQSAGLILYRKTTKNTEIFLVHPGGPFWKNKDEGAWSIPKGEFTSDEEPLTAAIREFKEETGISIDGNFREFQPVVIKSGKKIFAWAIEKDVNEKNVISNSFEMEWPPKSGKMQSFPEVDRAGWFTLSVAKIKISQGQLPLLQQLEQLIGI